MKNPEVGSGGWGLDNHCRVEMIVADQSGSGGFPVHHFVSKGGMNSQKRAVGHAIPIHAMNSMRCLGCHNQDLRTAVQLDYFM